MSTFGPGSYGVPPPLPVAAPVFAGFWIRFVAYVIDAIILSAVNWAVIYALGGGRLDLSDADLAATSVDPMLVAASVIVPAIYTIGFWVNSGATPGKMLLRLRVVDATTGQPIKAGQAVGRFFAYFVSSVVLCLGFLWVAFDARKQGWHDKLASTVVIRG